MANENLKDFAIEWSIFALLFFSLMTFASLFVSFNNPTAFGDTQDKFDTYTTSIQSNLLSLENESNVLLNVSALNNPEESFLGSRDSVATSYGIMGTAKAFLDSLKLFMGWIFTGASGRILISVLVGMFGILSLYFITKWIRTGA